MNPLRVDMIGIDTNVLIRYLIQDDEVQSSKATKLIEQYSGISGSIFITKLTLCKVLNSVKRVNVTAVAYNDLKALTLFDKPSYLFCVQFFLEKPTLKMHN